MFENEEKYFAQKSVLKEEQCIKDPLRVHAETILLLPRLPSFVNTPVSVTSLAIQYNILTFSTHQQLFILLLCFLYLFPEVCIHINIFLRLKIFIMY